MNYDCSLVNRTQCVCVFNADVSKFKFQSEKTHHVCLINAGAEGLQKFTIDDHSMTVITTDFTPIRPYKTNVVTLGVGQRVGVLVEGNPFPKGAYWMRSDISTECSHPNQPNSIAAIDYEPADMNAVPQSTKTAYNATSHGRTEDSLQLTEPLFPEEASSNPTTVQTTNVTLGASATAAQV
jgi:hypothetical protein